MMKCVFLYLKFLGIYDLYCCCESKARFFGVCTRDLDLQLFMGNRLYIGLMITVL